MSVWVFIAVGGGLLFFVWLGWLARTVPTRIAENAESRFDINWSRLVTWGFTLLFTCLPFLTLVTVNRLNGTLKWSLVADSPDLLFMAVVVPSIAWNNIREFREEVDGVYLSGFAVSFIVMAMCSAILYGIHSVTLLTEDLEPIRRGLLNITIGLSLMGAAAATTTEWIMARSEGRNP